MSLRTRLFLWVGLVFLLASIISLFLEVRLTDVNLQRAERGMRAQIFEMYEQNRQHIEENLRLSLNEDQAIIDALLFNLVRDKNFFGKSIFMNAAPTLDAAVLFRFNQWIDFIQMKDALLIPLSVPMHTAEKIADGEQNSWVYIGDATYRGVANLLFPLQPGDTPPKKPPVQPERQCMEDQLSAEIQLLERVDQAIMLTELASHLSENPLGIARFDEAEGRAFFTKDVFYTQKFFDAEGYFTAHPPKPGCPHIGSRFAIIAPPQMERVFLGNVLQLEDKNLLTIGVDLSEMIKKVALTLHQTVVASYEGRIVSGYSPDGERITPEALDMPLTEEMKTKKSGLVKWKDETYYFLHSTPFQGINLDFYLLNPEKDAFALITMLDDGTRTVIHQLSWSMRLIALGALFFVLALLHSIAKHVTRPITALAQVTEQVAAGKLENIVLPEVSPSRHDEVAVLCSSFEKMIKGLQEKERVRGVLNKVVSPEIAQEILKGTVHLGGEEKKVTVLFGDIRRFTEMTRNMEPTKVIELLNGCMTKVSHVIDEYGGVIDKYVGDEVMALFGAPLTKEDSALQAVLCAQKMVEALEEWNVGRKERVEMGIGIHTGLVVAGNMGAENRLNYTVLGSNVNFAARLCENAKGMQILISKQTLDEPHVRESITVEELPPMELKGFEGKMTIYAVKK